MAFNRLLTRVLATLSILSAVLADPTFDSQPISDINANVAINVPSNGTDDLFFQFTAPSKYAWVGFGFGSSMSGALVFVMYPSSDGKNVTLSPRIASGHSQPQYTSNVQVQALEGTGIQNGNMVFNAHCVGCRSWTSGKIDITSQQQSMIWAAGASSSTSTPVIQSNSLTQGIQQHTSNYGTFSVNLKKATGEAGLPGSQSSVQGPGGNSTNSTTPAQGGNAGESDGDSGDGDQHDFPIFIHAVLVLACFVLVLPAGYLFLRVFEKVWLHAGTQTLGIVLLVGGVAAGIVCNVQHQMTISYHQVLGIITTVLMFSAFTLGLISHQYFKKHKVSSPLMKFHRMSGPGSIVFGWGTIISGFIYRGNKVYILPFMVVLLAVVIFVGGITFLMRKRKMRKDAMKTPAAQNFQQGYFQQQQQQHQSHAAPPGYPMQTFSRPFPPQQSQQQQSYPYPTPGQQAPYMNKGPGINVRPVQV